MDDSSKVARGRGGEGGDSERDERGGSREACGSRLFEADGGEEGLNVLCGTG